MKAVDIAKGLASLLLGVLLGWAASQLYGRTQVAVAPTNEPALPQGEASSARFSEGEIKFTPTPQAPSASEEIIPAGIPIVYAFYDLSSTREMVRTASWHASLQERHDIPLSEIRHTADSAGMRGVIWLRAPGKGFAPGIYELEIHTDRRTIEASFVVAAKAEAMRAQSPPAEPQVRLTQHLLVSRVAKDGRPAESPRRTFSPQETVFYVLRYEGGEPGMSLNISWRYEGTEITSARREIVLPSPSGWAYAWISATDGLPSGNYEVSVSSSGDPNILARDQFLVH